MDWSVEKAKKHSGDFVRIDAKPWADARSEARSVVEYIMLEWLE